MPDKEKGISWQPVILMFFTVFFCIIGYTYKQDMSYLKESITEIRLNQKDFTDKFENKHRDLEERVRSLEIKLGEK